MPRTLSYRNVLELVIEDPDTIDALESVVDQHKNWGQFVTRVPSWVIVALVDAYKKRAEQQLGSLIPVVEDDADVLPED